MEKTKNNVRLVEEESIVTLFDDKDAPVDFFEIACIDYEGKFYEMLQPAQPIEGIGEDEAVIFEYIVDEKTQDKNFIPLMDEELLNNIFELYLSATAQMGCGCGGDCDCEGECDCDDESCNCEDGCDCESKHK